MVTVHRIEGVTHPGLVFGEGNAAVGVRIHALEIAGRVMHGLCTRGRGRRDQCHGNQHRAHHGTAAKAHGPHGSGYAAVPRNE